MFQERRGGAGGDEEEEDEFVIVVKKGNILSGGEDVSFPTAPSHTYQRKDPFGLAESRSAVRLS